MTSTTRSMTMTTRMMLRLVRRRRQVVWTLISMATLFVVNFGFSFSVLKDVDSLLWWTPVTTFSSSSSSSNRNRSQQQQQQDVNNTQVGGIVRKDSNSNTTTSSSTPPLPTAPLLYPISVTNKRRKPPHRIMKVPHPIFALNLPKSGTLSIANYFGCGLGTHYQAHHWMRNYANAATNIAGNGLEQHTRLGVCMGRNHAAGRPLVQGCGDYTVYTDAGAMWYDDDFDGISKNKNTSKKQQHCFYPGIHGLDNIARFYTNATILHVIRNTTEWIASARKWYNLLGRMATFCKKSGGFPHANASSSGSSRKNNNNISDEVWSDFYEQYAENIRTFAREHPSITYIEAKLESPEMPQILQEAIGLPEDCFGHHHKTSDINVVSLNSAAAKKKKKELEEDKQQQQQVVLEHLKRPVFVLNLPASGIVHLQKYFRCGLGVGRSASKFFKKNTTATASGSGKTKRMLLAECMFQNQEGNQPLVQGCGNFSVYMDAGAVFWNTKDENKQPGKTRVCFFPGIHGLQNIAQHYPNATLLHVITNNPRQQWVPTARKYNNLLARLSVDCDSNNGTNNHSSLQFPPPQDSVDDDDNDDRWVTFYKNYAENIRAFARNYPYLTYIEAELEGSDDAAAILETALGIEKSCFSAAAAAAGDKKKNNNTTAPTIAAVPAAESRG